MRDVSLFAITLLVGMCLASGSSVSQQMEDYLPNTVLIKAKEPLSSIGSAAGVVTTDQDWFNTLSASYNLRGVQSVFRNPHPLLAGWYRITYDSDISVSEMVTIMKIVPEILASEPEYYVQAELNAVFPDDPSYPSQWNLSHVDLPMAWDIVTGKSSVVIGVVDDGVSTQRLDIVNQLWVNPGELCDGIDNDNNGYIDDKNGIDTRNGTAQNCNIISLFHGTHVASIAAAQTNNNYLMSGVAGGGNFGETGSRLMICATRLTDNPPPTSTEIAGAISYAWQEGASVVNMSMGFVNNHQIIHDAISAGYSAGRSGLGTIFVAASGNVHLNPNKWPQLGDLVYPADWSEVISVGAIEPDGTRWDRSMYNDAGSPDIMAPGADVLGLLNSAEETGLSTGTSMASPHAVGLVALILSVNPNLSQTNVYEILALTATSMNEAGTGVGRISAHEAVKAAIPNRYSVPGTLPLNLVLGSGYHIFARPDPDPDPNSFVYYYVNGSLTIQSGAVAVVESNVRVVADAGETITCDAGSRVILEPGAELMCGPGGTIADNGGDVIFQGPGACMATTGGLLKFGSGVTRRVNNSGLIAAASPGTVELGANATLIIESTGTLNWGAPATWIFGTNSKVEVYGKVAVADNVSLTLPRTSQFNSYAGAIFDMGNNSKVVINGKFQADGTSGSPIQLVLKTGATSWSGINVKNQTGYTDVDATFTYCQISGTSLPFKLETPVKVTIQNCTLTSPSIGVQILPDLSQPEAIPSYQIKVKYNVISSVNAIGISVQNYSDLLIQGNTITGTQIPGGPAGGTGIHCSAASPRIVNNNITLCYRGLHCINQSSPFLEYTLTGGNNIIRDNIHGVRCDNGSNPVLGQVSNGSDPGGQNSIFNNTTYNVQLTNNCNVNAQKNWWGSTDTLLFKLSVDGTSGITYNPYLTSDPNPPLGPIRGGKDPQLAAGFEGEGKLPVMDPLISRLINQAIEARSNGDYLGALSILTGVIANPLEPTEIKSWAVSEVLANAMNVRSQDISTYLRGVDELYPNLYESVKQALVSVAIDEFEISDAISQMDSNITRYPNSLLECTGLYGRFAVVLFRNNDISAAQTFLDSLKLKYPDSGEAELASEQLNLVLNIGLERSNVGQPALTVQEEGPFRFRLAQNYPNPFNPSTVIQYELATDARVQLKLYDILGREVLTLVDDIQQEGPHEVTLNANTLATGVYLYRIQAGPYTDVKKLLVVK